MAHPFPPPTPPHNHLTSSPLTTRNNHRDHHHRRRHKMTTSFTLYNETWLQQLHHLTTQLRALPAHLATPDDHQRCRHLVNKLLSHYADYYRVKSATSHNSDVLNLFAAPWSVPLERSLHWIAGFRPTTIFHLLYTELSIRFEPRVVEILHGERTGDLGELSPRQLNRVSEMQCETVRVENEISEELGRWQEGMLAEVVGSRGGDGGGVEERLRGLKAVVEKADELRIGTIRRVVELLTPQQGVEFLIAVAEWQLGIRSWGLHLDRRSGCESVT